MVKDFTIGYPDPNEGVEMRIIIPFKYKVAIIYPKIKPKLYLECIILFDPVYFKNQKTEYLYNLNDAYFIHKN